MSTPDQGFFGYNKINPYGENANRVWAKLEGATLGSVGTASTVILGWPNIEADEYGMSVIGGGNTAYGFLTQEAGYYEVYVAVNTVPATAACNVTLNLFLTQSSSFDSSGILNPVGANQIGRCQILQGAGGYYVDNTITRRVWLPKDVVVYATLSSDSNVTNIVSVVSGQCVFEIRLISPDVIGLPRSRTY